MLSDIYTELAWLCRAPDNFNQRCAALLGLEGDLGGHVRALASYALDENQSARLAKVIRRAIDEQRIGPSLTQFRLGVISNATTDFIVPVLVTSAARHGVALECISAEFDQAVQAAIDPESIIHRAHCDAVLVALDYRGLPLNECPGDAKAAAIAVAAAVQHLGTIRAGICQKSTTICICQTLARPPETLFGNMDLGLPGTYRHLVDAVNREITAAVVGTEDVLLDIAGLAETVGLANWHDPVQWNLAKIPFASHQIPLYADHVGRIIGALRGKSRRCLVLDLDNTIWGGVIGDDGVSGILLGQGDPTGEAYLSVQRAALMLRQRGVVLAVSSKNEDNIARSGFTDHPDMLLKEEHIAVFQANWNQKAINIAAIAEELSISQESIVFLDDNPVERDSVRQALSQVAIPDLPTDPALFPRILAAGGYFEALTFSAEDRKRANFYQDNARRVALQRQAGDLDSYLESLGMVITFQPFDEVSRARISQLINKSNQFNLTTRRYTEAQVREVEQDSDCFTLQVRLLDKFGDNGMICVVICRRKDDVWDIDTWLMSCRVLGRKVEIAVLQELLFQARQRGVRYLIGRFVPTERNSMVAEHYQRLGFVLESQSSDFSVSRLCVASSSQTRIAMEVRRFGFEIT